MSDFDETKKTSLRTSIAVAGSVDASAVTVAVAAASVLITATIAVPASTTSTAVQASLSVALSTAAAASSRLGIDVESTPTVAIAKVDSSLDDTESNVRSDDAEVDATVLVMCTVGGGTVLGLACAIAAFAAMRRRITRLHEENLEQKQEADAKLAAMTQRMTRLNQVVMKSSKAANSARSVLKEMKDGRNASRCQVQVGDSSTKRLVLSGSASSSRTIRRAKSELVPRWHSNSTACLLRLPPLELSPGASTTDSIGAAAMQAAWITSQEHDASNQDAAEDFEKAVTQMDLEAIDASIEMAARDSEKLDATVHGEEKPKVASTVYKDRVRRAASSNQMMMRKVAVFEGDTAF